MSRESDRREWLLLLEPVPGRPLSAALAEWLAAATDCEIVGAVYPEEIRLLLQQSDPLAVGVPLELEQNRSLFAHIWNDHRWNTQSPLVIGYVEQPVTQDTQWDNVDVVVSRQDFQRPHSSLIALLRTRERQGSSQWRQAQSVDAGLDELTLLRNAIVWNVAHELRTPLLQVKSAVALLGEEVGAGNRLLELATGATARLEGAVRNITLLNELVNESLDQADFEPVEPSDLIESAMRAIRRSWEYQGSRSRVRVRANSSLPSVMGDRQRLIIALQLLIDNALKFSRKRVLVSATREVHQVRFAVRDQGIGIPADKIERIFESFYQIDHSVTKHYGGMGIGLAIVRFILDHHMTRIAVETIEGTGSTFSFALPTA